MTGDESHSPDAQFRAYLTEVVMKISPEAIAALQKMLVSEFTFARMRLELEAFADHVELTYLTGSEEVLESECLPQAHRQACRLNLARSDCASLVSAPS